jgi:magnesium transporter
MTSVYEFSDNGRLSPAVSAELPPAGVNDGVVRWVRIVGPSQHELQEALRALGLPDAVLEALHGGDVRSRVVTHNHTLLMALPVLASVEVRVLMLWAACTPTALITAEEEALPAIDRVVTERCGAAPSGLTLLGLFIEVLEAAASNAGPAYLSLRRKLDEFADAVENNPLEVPPDALLAMGRQVAQLAMLCEDQIHGLMELQRCHSYVPPSDCSRDSLRDLVSDAGRVLKLLARMESRLHDLRQHQLHCLQDSTNRRLNMLAILSAIYLPATLIAGIYGMNFEHIPITQVPYGYFVVLSIMLLVVLGQLWFFHRHGWFK